GIQRQIRRRGQGAGRHPRPVLQPEGERGEPVPAALQRAVGTGRHGGAQGFVPGNPDRAAARRGRRDRRTWRLKGTTGAKRDMRGKGCAAARPPSWKIPASSRLSTISTVTGIISS